MDKTIKWDAYTGENRTDSIEKVKKAISASDSYIVNFSMFSDLALALRIEVEENKIKSLHDNLTKVLKTSTLDSRTIGSRSKKTIIVYLNISFSSGTGNLKTIIPEVPG